MRGTGYILGKDLEEQISRITMLEKDIAKSDTIKELMGLEGNIHREYYSAWQTIFDNKVNFSSRVRRPPDNMVNTLISFLNMMVYSTCLSEIYVTPILLLVICIVLTKGDFLCV